MLVTDIAEGETTNKMSLCPQIFKKKKTIYLSLKYTTILNEHSPAMIRTAKRG